MTSALHSKLIPSGLWQQEEICHSMKYTAVSLPHPFDPILVIKLCTHWLSVQTFLPIPQDVRIDRTNGGGTRALVYVTVWIDPGIHVLATNQ